MDPRDVPAYRMTEAAAYLGLSPSTVRYWVKGGTYKTKGGRRTADPIIPAHDSLLSFRNLVELHVLSSMRRAQVPMAGIRQAVEHLKAHFNSDHPLADQQLFIDGKDVVYEELGSFVSAVSGQAGFGPILEAYVKRIERDENGALKRLFPFTRTDELEDQPRFVVITPGVSFGRPAVSGIPTRVLSGRFAAGDSLTELVADFGLSMAEIEEALRIERRAA